MGSLDSPNAVYWDHLCGSYDAQRLGIKDHSPTSLKRFDDWYFGFYPYLLRHVPLAKMRSLDVLEVGLGFGTLSQAIAVAGARYQGLDVAPNAVGIVNARLSELALSQGARIGSILAPPFPAESFDWVVAIGSLHHTGDLRRAIAECHRLLRPSGTLVCMVYNAYGHYRWLRYPVRTSMHAISERLGHRPPPDETSTAYDPGAPHTEFVSQQALRDYCQQFAQVTCMLENARLPWPLDRLRLRLLRTPLPRFSGLDIYLTAVKGV